MYSFLNFVKSQFTEANGKCLINDIRTTVKFSGTPSIQPVDSDEAHCWKSNAIIVDLAAPVQKMPGAIDAGGRHIFPVTVYEARLKNVADIVDNCGYEREDKELSITVYAKVGANKEVQEVASWESKMAYLDCVQMSPNSCGRSCNLVFACCGATIAVKNKSLGKVSGEDYAVTITES